MVQEMDRGPTRLLIVTKYFREGYGGTPEAVLLLARNLLSIGVSCDALSTRGLVRDVGLLDAIPKAIEVGASIGKLDLKRYAGLFVAGPWNLQALKSSYLAKRAGVPFIYAGKGGLSAADFVRLRDIKKVPYFWGIEVFLWAWAKAIIFSSPVERDNCIVPKFLWQDKYVIIPEPFSPPSPPAFQKVPAPAVVLGFLAEIRSLKGLRELVEAMAILRLEPVGPQLQLRIAGTFRPGSEKYVDQIRAFADRQGLSEHIEWMGAVRGDANRSEFYDSLDIFVCPSKSESFGLTPLEALWHGVPIALGANIGVRAYIPSDAPAIVIAKITPEDVASAIREFISRREIFADSAKFWRGRLLPDLSGEALARNFVAAIGC